MMLIVVPSKPVDLLLRVRHRCEPMYVQTLFPEATMKDSIVALSVGLPRRLKSRITPLVYAHRSITALTNSVPLSQ